LKACGLTSLPDRRIFDWWLKTTSPDIKEMIVAMAALFVKERLVDAYIVTIDIMLLKAKGHLWHKSCEFGPSIIIWREKLGERAMIVCLARTIDDNTTINKKQEMKHFNVNANNIEVEFTTSNK
jgi:hypothetical protein